MENGTDQIAASMQYEDVQMTRNEENYLSSVLIMDAVAIEQDTTNILHKVNHLIENWPGKGRKKSSTIIIILLATSRCIYMAATQYLPDYQTQLIYHICIL